MSISKRESKVVLHYKAHMKAYEVLSALRARLERQEGQALVEYALILALIAVVSIAILQSLGLNVKRVFTSVDSSLSSVAP
jgi:pilus assembly protein Flp/PilA